MKKMNSKGFTLIELLAVIIVLGVVMVISVPNVMNTMNTAKKKSLKIYGERILTLAQEQYASETFQEGKVYTLSDLGLNTTGEYVGCVIMNGTSTAPKYSVYLSDDAYCYNNMSGDLIDTSEPAEGECTAAVKNACHLN